MLDRAGFDVALVTAEPADRIVASHGTIVVGLPATAWPLVALAAVAAAQAALAWPAPDQQAQPKLLDRPGPASGGVRPL